MKLNLEINKKIRHVLNDKKIIVDFFNFFTRFLDENNKKTRRKQQENNKTSTREQQDINKILTDARNTEGKNVCPDRGLNLELWIQRQVC